MITIFYSLILQRCKVGLGPQTHKVNALLLSCIPSPQYSFILKASHTYNHIFFFHLRSNCYYNWNMNDFLSFPYDLSIQSCYQCIICWFCKVINKIVLCFSSVTLIHSTFISLSI